jgi:hypothetical protein
MNSWVQTPVSPNPSLLQKKKTYNVNINGKITLS